jgi:hypothetical protein
MDILLSTTHVIDGRPVSRYLGIVTGEAIVGANIFRDMFASVRDIVGGRSATYERGRDRPCPHSSGRALIDFRARLSLSLGGPPADSDGPGRSPASV